MMTMRELRDVNADLLAALERLMDEGCPFECDGEGCECGDNGTGFDDDGRPCEHIQARRAIARARGDRAEKGSFPAQFGPIPARPGPNPGG